MSVCVCVWRVRCKRAWVEWITRSRLGIFHSSFSSSFPVCSFKCVAYIRMCCSFFFFFPLWSVLLSVPGSESSFLLQCEAAAASRIAAPQGHVCSHECVNLREVITHNNDAFHWWPSVPDKERHGLAGSGAKRRHDPPLGTENVVLYIYIFYYLTTFGFILLCAHGQSHPKDELTGWAGPKKWTSGGFIWIYSTQHDAEKERERKATSCTNLWGTNRENRKK